MPSDLKDPRAISLVRRSISYDPRTDMLMWLARTPEDFGTKDPERTAVGWNRKWAGQPVSVKKNGQIAVQIQGIELRAMQNRFREVVGAPLIPVRPRAEPEVRPSSGRGLSDEIFIRAVFTTISTPEGRRVVWAMRNAEINDAIRVTAGANWSPKNGRYPAAMTVRGMKVFNARMAGKKVRPSKSDGFVYVGGVIRIEWDVLLEVMGVRWYLPPEGEVRQEARPLSSSLVRAVFSVDEDGRVFLRPRDQETWERLVAERVVDEVPSPEAQARWNARNAQTNPAVVRNQFRLHYRTIGMGRVRREAMPEYGF